MVTMTPAQEFLVEGAERLQNDDPTGATSIETALGVAKTAEERRFVHYALAHAYRQVGIIYLERFEEGFDYGASERMQRYNLSTANVYLKRSYERFRDTGLKRQAGLVLLDMARMALATNMHRRAIRLIVDANRLMRGSRIPRPNDIVMMFFIGIDWMLSRLPGSPSSVA